MSATTIAAFARFKRTLEAARDFPYPDSQGATALHLQGLRAGLQVAIDGIDAEIRILLSGERTNNHTQGE